jgi:hypothetical protein
MRFIIAATALLAASVAFAQDAGPPPFTIELTAQEGALIAGMLDQAIKQGGYASAKQITPIMDKMIAASQKAQAAAAEAAKKAEFDRMKADEAKKPAPLIPPNSGTVQ